MIESKRRNKCKMNKYLIILLIISLITITGCRNNTKQTTDDELEIKLKEPVRVEEPKE